MSLNKWYLVVSLIQFTMGSILLLAGWVLKEGDIYSFLMLMAVIFLLYIASTSISSMLTKAEQLLLFRGYVQQANTLCQMKYGKDFAEVFANEMAECNASSSSKTSS